MQLSTTSVASSPPQAAPGRAPGGKFRLFTSTPGLSYVAVSRVKTLDGIMFDAPFDHQSICGSVTPERDPRRLDAVRRQAHHLPADVYE
ncbi:hypothetical protein E4U59_007550, partial [Claviceps monticola]